MPTGPHSTPSTRDFGPNFRILPWWRCLQSSGLIGSAVIALRGLHHLADRRPQTPRVVERHHRPFDKKGLFQAHQHDETVVRPSKIIAALHLYTRHL